MKVNTQKNQRNKSDQIDTVYQHDIEDVVSQFAALSIQDQEESSAELSRDEPTNATAILDHYLPGVNHLVALTIVVEGEVIRQYKKLVLKQHIKTHHEFVLELAVDSFKDETYEMKQAQNLLGKRILITIHYKHILDKPERDFYGVITDVCFQQAYGSQGYVVLKGNSPTILLDRAPNIQSFGGDQPASLTSIVSDLLREGYENNGKYKFVVRSSKNCKISYSCQYNETPYNYLARTAEAYGEQFFYDGEQLYFGDLPAGEKPIKLVYGRDVENIEIRIQARHVTRLLYGYNSETNKKLSASSNTSLKLKGALAQTAYQKSERIFTTPSLQLVPVDASTDQEVQQAQRGVVGSEGLDVFVISGETTVPFLYPGCIVMLDMLDGVTKELNHFTTLMITAIVHSVDTLGQYQGRFEAVDAQAEFIPRIDYTLPLAEQQIATVVSHADPLQMGRVQVQFDWQYRDQHTTWIRVMSPDAGHSDQGGKNRGLVAIPEVGDQVMVGFVGNHPDRPFVLGGLFHGEAAAGGGKDNNNRSFSSKSGNALKFNDAEGSVTLHDKGTVNQLFDGEGNALIRADKNHTIHAGNAHILSVGATEEQPPQSAIKADAEGNILIEARTSISLQVGKNRISIDKEGVVTVAECGNIETLAKNGGISIKSTSDNVTVESETAVLCVKGATETNLGGGSTTNLTGGVVNTNEI
ncbi:type VI secretion system Vgr family protein [Myroides sp. C8-3]|uniref:type VI secretion system Vgr family protein n=1 Tax=Myroides sp. C8-3 TaxID=3400533 RepID=UPI003D2F6DC7